MGLLLMGEGKGEREEKGERMGERMEGTGGEGERVREKCEL